LIENVKSTSYVTEILYIERSLEATILNKFGGIFNLES